MSWVRWRKRELCRSSRRFVSEPVRRLSTETTEVAPSRSSRSQRWDPRKPAPPSTAARFPFMPSKRVLDVLEGRLSWKLGAVLLKDEIDALPDVLRHRNLRLLVQELQLRVLLRGDVDGGGKLLPRHGQR